MSVNVGTKTERNKTWDKYFERLNLLKGRYKQHVRDNFLNTFGKFYCCEMNIPVVSGTLKTCNHHENTLDRDNNIKLKVDYHRDLVSYMKNIIAWLDLKMDYNVNDHNTLRVLTQKNIKTSIDYTFSKKRKLSQSHINHIEENISNNSQGITQESLITTICNNSLKENKSNSYNFIENTNVSDNLEKETIISNTLNCLTDQKENISEEINVNNEMNFPKAEIVGSLSKTVLLEKTPKQEKSFLTTTSNDFTKQISKNMYSRNRKGETKMHNACAKGNFNLVTALLTAGFNPNVKDNAGWTPLHEAVKAGYLDIVQELINYGAYVNVPGFEYESPLHLSVMYNKFDIAKLLLRSGADSKCIDMYGRNLQCLNEEMSALILESQSLCTPLVIEHKYEMDQITIFLNNVSLNNDIIIKFCKQFNIKLVKNILNEKQLAQMTHIIVPETEYNTCAVNLECLIGMANGLFIVNQNWISDSLRKNILMNCENYEVSGTASFIDHNGPKISRINKQKLYPKLFDGISVYINGGIGWEKFSLEHLKKLVLEFGSKLLKRMPNPEDCVNTIVPYHCQNSEQLYNVSTIILYTEDSKRLIKYNMKHLKAFPISWFMETIQKHSFI